LEVTTKVGGQKQQQRTAGEMEQEKLVIEANNR